MINSGSNISFTGTRPVVETGRKAITTIQKEFPNYPSCTRIAQRVDNFAARGIDIEFIKPRLLMILLKSALLSEKVNYNIKPFSRFVLKLKRPIRHYKVMNCEEYAYLVQDELQKRGLKSNIVKLKVETDPKNPTVRGCDAHWFNVANLREGATLSNPKTWGNKAIIVDGWAKISGRARDVIMQYEEMFRLNPKTETLSFAHGSKYSTSS